MSVPSQFPPFFSPLVFPNVPACQEKANLVPTNTPIMSVLSNLEGSTWKCQLLKHNFHHQIFDSKSRHHHFLEFQALGFEGKQPFKSWYACSISCLSSRIFLACNSNFCLTRSSSQKTIGSIGKEKTVCNQQIALKETFQIYRDTSFHQGTAEIFVRICGSFWYLVFPTFINSFRLSCSSFSSRQRSWHQVSQKPSLASGQKVREWTTTKIIQQKTPTFYDSLLFFRLSFYFSLCLGIRLQTPTSFTIFSIPPIIYTSVFESKEFSSKMSPSFSQT